MSYVCATFYSIRLHNSFPKLCLRLHYLPRSADKLGKLKLCIYLPKSIFYSCLYQVSVLCLMSGIFPEGLDNDKVVQFANCVVNIYIDQSAVVPPYIWQIIYLEKDSKRSTR